MLSVRDNFWPLAVGPNPARRFEGLMNTSLTVLMLLCAVTILGAAFRRWWVVSRSTRRLDPVPVDS